jgi:hypothetical protein
MSGRKKNEIERQTYAFRMKSEIVEEFKRLAVEQRYQVNLYLEGLIKEHIDHLKNQSEVDNTKKNSRKPAKKISTSDWKRLYDEFYEREKADPYLTLTKFSELKNISLNAISLNFKKIRENEQTN